MTTAKNPSPFTQSQPSPIGAEFPTKTRCGAWSDFPENDSFWQADIVGDVGNQTLAVSMNYVTSMTSQTTLHITGPTITNEAEATVAVVQSTFPHGGWSWNGGLGASGTFTVAADMRHGTIDVVLPGLFVEGTATPSVAIHVSGEWRCA